MDQTRLDVDPTQPFALSDGDALFLDFDGTLVEIADHPELVRPPQDLAELLQACAERLDGALAIISGRRLQDIDAFLQPLKLPGAGLHGAELRSTADAALELAEHANLAAAAAAVRAELGDLAGLLIENKGAALAVHYRHCPHAAAQVERALRRAVEQEPVEIVAGKFVFEARPRGIDKGSAVRRLMQVAPFAGRRPIFVGDDVTDEDGIAAVQSLDGFGIKVGGGSSAARHRLQGPAAVADWLRRGVQQRSPR